MTTTPLVTTHKKLIETSLPLEAINKACAREKSIRHGHPSTLHLWWARRPLAAARAVIFAQMVDDPSSLPDLFPTEKKQEKERQRLFKIIEDLVLWENTTNETVLQAAREEIWASWRRACAENADHPRAKELFDRKKLPAFHDPFAGGGALPLEAQRLGLESYASDLNPVAVLINKAMIEIPPKFAGKPPVNPDSRKEKRLIAKEWKGAQGLAEDVRFYGQWMRDEAQKRIGHLYPKIEVTDEMVKVRPDLKKYVGQKLTVIAWLWARTVKSPNPAFAKVGVPLASSFMLSTKVGKEAYVEPVIENGGYRFTVKVGKPKDAEGAKRGTKSGSSGSSFLCLMSGTPMPFEYLRPEAKAGRMGARLMAMVAEGDRGRVYLAPTPEMEAIALRAKPTDAPETDLPAKALGFRVQEYGMTKWRDLFTSRQLVALTTFSDLVGEARELIKRDAIAAGLPDDKKPLHNGGIGAHAYADAVGVYLGFTVSRQANRACTISFWDNTSQKIQQAFGRQALPMTWDFCESNPFSDSSGNWLGQLIFPAKSLDAAPADIPGFASQQDAQHQGVSKDRLVSTDPPYYDNIGYADLSDFFYVWLRRALQPVFPELFGTLAVPKAEELVATPYRHGTKEKAETFFLDGMTLAMHRLAEQAHPAFPVTIYYAFKQSESDGAEGTTNTGWDTFLAAVIKAGFAISGTWPMRTELTGNLKKGVAALASSIVLVCRPRAADAPTITRAKFVRELESTLPNAFKKLQSGNIAPADMGQAAIGPGMEIFTKYSKVLEPNGEAMSVGAAHKLIIHSLSRLNDPDSADYDDDSRWALAWFEEHGFETGEFGKANTIANAKNVGINGLVTAGIVHSRSGKVRLLKREELHDGNPLNWDPTRDNNISAWEAMQHVIHRHQTGGVTSAGELLSTLGAKADHIKDLSYRLYGICERKRWSQEAIGYNALVSEWGDIVAASRKLASKAVGTDLGGLFGDEI